RRGEQIKEGNDIVGNKARVKVVKNKVAAPFKTCEVDIVFGKGISKTGEIVDIASEMEILKKSGSWYAYKDSKVGQGRENVKKYLEENPEIYEEIYSAVKEKMQK
ncbi:MAG: recombinase RecA, partial [Candidatus Izemoplasmatales bacterium]|nr:recombinase RecA [Candidatus Izemoplasmatales bacterium]